MKSLAFVINSRIKNKAELLKSLKSTAKANESFSLAWEETSGAKSAITIAKKFANEGREYIIAVGGDGTIHETVNGIMQSSNVDVILGVLPWGTANDFCKSAFTPTSIVGILAAIESDLHQEIDVGSLDYQGKESSGYFVNIADLGIGAEVVQRVNSSSKFFGPNLTFMSAIIQTFLTYKNQELAVKTPDWEWEGKANSLVIANGKFFGSGLCIAPDADLSDGQFDVVIIGDISIYDYLKNVRKIRAGKMIKHPEVFYKKASKLEVSCPVACGLEADGESLGYTPVEVRLEQHKIRILKKPAG